LTLFRLSRPAGSDVRHALAGAAAFGVLWTVIEIWFGRMSRRTYSPIEVVWWRYTIHLLLSGALWGFTRRRALVRTNRLVFQLARSLMMVTMPGAYIVGLYFGVQTDFMWSIFWTAPAAIMLLSWWWLGERPSGLWFGLAVAGALASVLIYGHVQPLSLLSVACAAAMQLSFVFYFVMTRALHEEPIEANLFYTALAPFVVLGLLTPFVWVAPGLHDVLVMTAIGVFGFAALYALDFACHVESASICALGLFAYVPAVFALTSVDQGIRLGIRAAAGSIALVIILILAWLFASAALPSRTEGNSQ
jgi:drug/metabolite transporter (DMT)-like permease